MSFSEASGLWDTMAARLSAGPATEGDLWDLLEERADVASFRPQLAADIEIKEFNLRWGNDYAMIANPRELIHYELTPNQIRLVKLMDGTRTVKEILVEGLDDAEALELSGLADLIDQLYAGGFLVTPYVDADTAVAEAIKPATTGQRKVSEFVRHQTIDWKGADRFVRALYRGGVRFLFDPPVVVGSVVLVAIGLAAFVDVVSWHRFDLNAQNLAWGLLLLTFLNYFLTFCHELGHATGLVHFGRRVKSAGFMIYFGSIAFFIESADGLMMERRQRMLQAFAGGYAEMIFCGIASILVWAFPGMPVAAVLYKFAVLGYLVIFLNWIPLLELDGYFIVADLIQVPDLRPRSIAFLRHDLWHKLRARHGFTTQEIGLLVYGIAGVAFSIFVLYLSFFFWRTIFGGLVSSLWHGGALSRFVLAALALVVLAPLLRGGIDLARALWRRGRALWRRVRFRLERGWRVEAAELIDALPLFDDLEGDVLSDLAGLVKLRTLARGQPVVRQGERADAFYVIRRGTLQVVEENPSGGSERVLRVMGRGEAFGELGLVEGSPRTATVRALQEAEVFELAKGVFERFLGDNVHVPEFAPTVQAVAELGELPVFAQLETDERSGLLEHGEWVNIAPGETVLEQGAPGDAFYAIRSGSVDVYEDGEWRRTMGPGTYFGEIALLLDVPRTASIVARTQVRAFRLDREGFDRLVREAFRRGTLNPLISPDTMWKH